ncbi:unnamed protein product [Coffea canephora]|uniref:Uncharacterized protein n=1 Tax=Coffea canephora TaxID=49390 RepID=A0A068V4Z5_COFCA|nr:unnamed protein product [Coffea canephora]
MNVVASRDDIHAPTRQQQVASSLRPNFCQDLSDSVCFYQTFNSTTPSSLASYSMFTCPVFSLSSQLSFKQFPFVFAYLLICTAS